jgi:serine/threonine-protein kinase
MGFLSGLFGGPRRVDLWKRFKRLSESHTGTMSTFYKVRDSRDGEVRGLKLIDVARQAPVEGRYKGLGKPNEGEIGSRIRGDHVARTLEWGVATTGEPFVLTEYVDGVLLHTLLRTGKPLAAAERIDLVRQAAAAVGAVHAAGFVHRDICPRNLILRSDGRLVIFDFGLAVPDQPAFLQPGNRVGTPHYMAPEVVRRRQADRRLDMFSLGVTAYEICTRRLPWGAAKSGSGAAALAHDSPPDDIRSHWPEIPPSLAAAVQACIAANPAVRPATTEAFLRLFANVPAST